MKINIADITLDVQNFRHATVATEREAMRILLSGEKTHKVFELANDIVEMRGLDPSSLLIVMNDDAHPGHYIALEGNRRITALKTLINPELAADLPTYAQFKKLSSGFLALGITQIECTILDRKTAFDWIKRKHYNGMGGRGVMPWNALATARSDASEGRPPRWMISLDLAATYGHSADDLLDGISSKTTTVERVLSSSHMSTILGISFDAKARSIAPDNGDLKAAAGLIAAMLADMARKDFTEPTVTTADLQQIYIEGFEHLNVLKKPASTGSHSGASSKSNGTSTGTGQGSSGATGHGGAPGTGGGAGSTGPAQAAAATAGATAKSKAVRQRNKLADKGLRISNKALNRLYSELRKLNVEVYPHVGAAMNRIFLEKATLIFLEDMNVACRNPAGWNDFNVKLKDKVAGALHTIDPQKKNTKLDYARDVANGVQNKLHTLDYLNQAIHNPANLPAASEIIGIWDRFHPYFEELFKVLESNGK
ncbi:MULTISPECIES: hypothetical protein [unclassified Rhizobium]|uniref:hypothetical protein n=1 Tax=unclassified Rhizobium TaxID=2613769 RepID=UPI001ADCF145|nr:MULTISPECIES: hypothetical protein [unclassified Rhizobium]MBO9125434.1 hypothetical protein [Rhizobium sp. 16-488-2b]MBO9176019.1 hypothetical protein [Rhizobium sp. 16-488-2a]